jgi:hypothetical protein
MACTITNAWPGQSQSKWVKPVLKAGNPYYNHASLCFPEKKLAAKEREEHKIRHFHLCDLCVLLRLFIVVAAQAALGPSVSIRG